MKTENTTATATQAMRGIAGYDVKILTFVPVDQSDLDAQIRIVQTLKRAMDGDLSAVGELIGMAKTIEVSQKFLTRRFPIEATEATGAGNEGQGAAEGSEGARVPANPNCRLAGRMTTATAA